MTKPHIVILAAGRGKRMHSQLVKVLHPVFFKPMIHYVIELGLKIPHQSITVVVGFNEEEVKNACMEYSEINFITQKNLLGTADAVKSTENFFKDTKGEILILSGDVVLLSKDTLSNMILIHQEKNSVCTLLTAKLPNPKGYGRIIRNSSKEIVDIREEADASDEERKINEVNAGIYLFRADILFNALNEIENSNKQSEYYLTDVIKTLYRKEAKIHSIELMDKSEMLGINDRYSLYKVESIIQKRINKELMLNGVSLKNPSTIFINSNSRIENDVVIEQGVQILNSVIETGVIIEQGSRIINSVIGKNTVIKQSSYITESLIGEECSIGPFAHLRPGTRLFKKVKIGNFVEVKKSVISDGVKASHLSYIGDSEIGKNVNIGCGFITCNYDGIRKNKTIIEDGVFVGSDSQTVAPVRIGARSYIASGTTVTKDVPEDSLVISRGKQITRPGYAKKYQRKENS